MLTVLCPRRTPAANQIWLVHIYRAHAQLLRKGRMEALLEGALVVDGVVVVELKVGQALGKVDVRELPGDEEVVGLGRLGLGRGCRRLPYLVEDGLAFRSPVCLVDQSGKPQS